MKKLFLILLTVLIINSILAIDLEITQKSSDETMIYEFQNPVNFTFQIKNLGENDSFMIYNLVSFQIKPEKITLNKGETKTINFTIIPLTKIKYSGLYSFSYYIRGKDKSEIKKELAFKIIPLKEAFEIYTDKPNISSKKIKITIKNKINYNFKEINADFNSAFFNVSKKFSLSPYEKKEFEIELNKEGISRLSAGFYTLNTKLKIKNETINIPGVIEFLERDNLISTELNYGLVINKHIIKKENKGNVLVKSNIVVTKNIISRLFTNFNPKPEVIQRNKFLVYYVWNKELQPGESFQVMIITNWLIPFFIVFLIIVIVILLKKYSKKDIDLIKKITFIKAKGGEFALKVSIYVKANEYVEKVNIIDKLPPLVKVYEKFGSQAPSRINEKARKIEWDFEQLEKGEKRILSYIIYSKLGILGKFAMPSTIAIYEKNGKIKESSSNRAFFISETKSNKEIDNI